MNIYNPPVDKVTIVRKTADETVNNSNVLQNDDELLLPIGANEVWLVNIRCITNSAGAADFKCNWTMPAGASSYQMAMGVGVGSSLTILIGTNTQWEGLGADAQVFFQDLIVVNGATAGNLQFQWAQNTANVSDTKVLAQSFIEARKLS